MALHVARLLLLWFALELGCTVVSDFDVHECQLDADCDSASGSISRCEQRRCVQGCADNRHCESVDPRRPLCEGSSGACVGLTTARGECFASTGYEPARMAEGHVED